MILKKTEDKLFRGMQESFLKHDFVFDAVDRSFKRSIQDGSQAFYFFVYNKRVIEIVPNWSIKLNNMTDIYHEITVKPPEAFQYTTVLDNSLFGLMEYVDSKDKTVTSSSKRYLIENEADIEILKNVIPIRFEEYVLPYFNLNSSVSRVDELLNRNQRELIIHQWLYPHRAIMGVIAAKLTNNPKFDELVTIYDEELKEAAPNYKQEFRNLKRLFNV